MAIFIVQTKHQQEIANFNAKDTDLILLNSQFNLSQFDGDTGEIILFNDVRPDLKEIKRMFDQTVLWQEGLIPYFGFTYNFRSYVRKLLSSKVFFNSTIGYRPYFYNNCDIIRTAYSAEHMSSMGIGSEIIVDKDIFSYRSVEDVISNYPIFFGAAFISNGMSLDHFAQIENYRQLKRVFPEIKFKPHPRDVYWFKYGDRADKLGLSLEFNVNFSSKSFGNLSTSLFNNYKLGLEVVIIHSGHSDIVQKAMKINICPFIGVKSSDISQYIFNQNEL
jgi:hypothetical protein